MEAIAFNEMSEYMKNFEYAKEMKLLKERSEMQDILSNKFSSSIQSPLNICTMLVNQLIQKYELDDDHKEDMIALKEILVQLEILQNRHRAKIDAS